MIKEWIDEYNPANQDEAEQALREILQEITLAGLQRSGFFEKAAFYGGTALRIFHGLDRYSEDLDFSLLEADPGFSFEPNLESIIREFIAVGIEVDIQEKKKTKQSNINSAFLKADTSWHELTLKNIIPQERPSAIRGAIKIKLEVDKQPPPGFETEEKLLLRPFSFYTKCFTLPDLFAGKMHALLFRKWINRVKGRDWYDMEWYIRKGVPLNLHHLALRAYDSGDWPSKKMSQPEFRELLFAKINSVNPD
ncbi:MAG: nucleotidyl transferase AbiEii/AbiGii toxin family protein, partial [Chitinophagaceae bacterium]